MFPLSSMSTLPLMPFPSSLPSLMSSSMYPVPSMSCLPSWSPLPSMITLSCYLYRQCPLYHRCPLYHLSTYDFSHVSSIVNAPSTISDIPIISALLCRRFIYITTPSLMSSTIDILSLMSSLSSMSLCSLSCFVYHQCPINHQAPSITSSLSQCSLSLSHQFPHCCSLIVSFPLYHQCTLYH